MIKRLLMKIVALAAIASTAYTLSLLDQVVQGTLYSYGLQFSYNWAAYWTLLRVTWVLLGITAVATVVNTMFIIHPGSKQEQRNVRIQQTQRIIRSIPGTTQTNEQQIKEPAPIILPASPTQPSEKLVPKHTPILAPAPSYPNTDIPGLFRCTHCGKAFTQPLRMLDFHEDPARIVNVCPFCSEIMPSELPDQKSEQTGRGTFSRRNDNHNQKPFTR